VGTTTRANTPECTRVYMRMFGIDHDHIPPDREWLFR
jgi:hypothetical protein